MFDETEAARIRKKLEEFGCTWEDGHLKSRIAVDVPTEIPYTAIKKYLDDGENNGFGTTRRRACVTHVKHEI